MTISNHIDKLAGLTIDEFQLDQTSVRADRALRISSDYEESDANPNAFAEKLAALVQLPGITELPALVIGPWQSDSSDGLPMQVFEAALPALRGLRHVFFGDIICEESEVSWITQGDHSRFIAGLPALESHVIRGSDQLSLAGLAHPGLRSLTIQAGGLPDAVIQQTLAAELPELERLELWLGDSDYGFDGNVESIRPLLDGKVFPRLNHLGLRNSEITNEIVAALRGAAILERLTHLDLSMGTITDEGAKDLLENLSIRKLESLNLDHHFLSEAMMKRLGGLGIPVSMADRQEAERDDGELWYFIEVSE